MGCAGWMGAMAGRPPTQQQWLTVASTSAQHLASMQTALQSAIEAQAAALSPL